MKAVVMRVPCVRAAADSHLQQRPVKSVTTVKEQANREGDLVLLSVAAEAEQRELPAGHRASRTTVVSEAESTHNIRSA